MEIAQSNSYLNTNDAASHVERQCNNSHRHTFFVLAIKRLIKLMADRYGFFRLIPIFDRLKFQVTFST